MFKGANFSQGRDPFVGAWGVVESRQGGRLFHVKRGQVGKTSWNYVRLANKLKSLIPYCLNIFSDKEKARSVQAPGWW